MKLSCSAYQAGSSYTQKILSGHIQNYGATSSSAKALSGDGSHGIVMPSWKVEEIEGKGSPSENPDSPNENSSQGQSGLGGGGGQSRSHVMGDHLRRSSGGAHEESSRNTSVSSHSDAQPDRHSDSTAKTHDSSRSPFDSPSHRYGPERRSRSKSVGEQQWTNLRAVMAWYSRLRRIKRSKSNQRWMKLRTTVQLSGAISSTIQKKPPLKREDSFLKRFSTRQIPESQETFEINEDDGTGLGGSSTKTTRRRKRGLPRTVVNPDGNFYFYWLMLLTFCVLYNLWTLIVRQSFPELQTEVRIFWIVTDAFSDLVFVLDIAVQFRTGYLEQGLMVYKTKKLSKHYIGSRPFYLDCSSLVPTDLLQMYFGTNPMLRFPRFLKVYRIYNYYYMVESRTVYPNVWRVVNLIHILLLLAHWFGCFYYLLSEAEGFIGPWVYPNPDDNGNFSSLTRKYLGSLYWSTLTLTTIGDLPTPYSNWQYLFTIVSYLIGVFIFATIVGQVGNVITNRNANRLEFERLLDGAKMYMRHHKVPRDMQRRVLRWYDYSWSRGRIQGGGDINTALGLLPDKLKTELALHVNLSVLKKVTIFQECQPEFLHDLVLKMKAYIFTPGDLICRKGEVAREMFIIADGILEVISELGKVLTTMQAGDFFGEIGILNLDGLNKRTADVRSVGYSELFSLSREDVLAAMKDYPEAQEILQTLGRKRLMEARKASAPAPKKVISSVAIVDLKKATPSTSHLSLARSHSSLSHKGPDTPETDNTSKRIVEKLRSDVRGLRNAIRRSRKSNSSKEDSSEPESGKDKADNSGLIRIRKKSSSSMADVQSLSSARGVLKRMHNVNVSDEKEREGQEREPSTSTSTSASSPAVLLKRVQLPLEEASAAAEPEVIGAGLPLIQRLRLLKKKEDKQQGKAAVVVAPTPPAAHPAAGPSSGISTVGPATAVSASTATTAAATADPTAGAGASSTTTSSSSLHPLRPTPDGAVLHTKVSIETPPKIDKESGKVSTNDSSVPGAAVIPAAAVLTRKSELTSESSPGPLDDQPEPQPPLPPQPTATATATTATTSQHHPGRRRSAFAMTSSTSTISSAEMASAGTSGTQHRGRRASSGTYGLGGPMSSTASATTTTARTATTAVTTTTTATVSGAGGDTLSGTASVPVLESESSGESTSLIVGPSHRIERPSALHFKQKNEKTYGSVDDLSPEFSRLPFIKKLKILNERQKIAELLVGKTSNIVLKRSTSEGSNETPAPAGSSESTMHSVLMGRRTQSSSEQYTTEVIIPHLPPDHPIFSLPPITPSSDYEPEHDNSSATDCLTRTIDNSSTATDRSTLPTCVIPSTSTSTSNSTTNNNPISATTTTTSTSIITTTTTTRIESEGRGKEEGDGGSPSRDRDLSPSPPQSPESNETPERRNLKSILKRLAEESASVESSEDEILTVSGGSGSSATMGSRGQSSSIDYQLLKAPTLEGYAARHRKFSKNVTFQRQAVAVVSPESLDTLTATSTTTTTQLPTDTSELYSLIDPSNPSFSQPTLQQHLSENMKTKLSSLALKESELLERLNVGSLGLSLGLGVAQEECIGGVFLGIKNIIQSKIEEMQVKFQDRFTSLEVEVRHRDDMISRLQHRIQELESKSNLMEQHQQQQQHQQSSSTNPSKRTNNHVSRSHAIDETSTTTRSLGTDRGKCSRSGAGGSSRRDSGPITAPGASSDYMYSSPPVQSYFLGHEDTLHSVISTQDFDDDVFAPPDRPDQLILSPRQMTQMLQMDKSKSSKQKQQIRHPQPQKQQQQQSSTVGAKWATEISQEETIEMSEFTSDRPLWELEFHRESSHSHKPSSKVTVPSAPPPGSVAVDIGNTSTEYESSSSSSEDEPTRKLVRSQTVIEATPRELAGFGLRSENSTDDEDGEGENDSGSGSSSDEMGGFTNQNWEVQMLAKEMERIEEEKTTPSRLSGGEPEGELQELENEIKEMRDAVTQGALSPTELDMLEAVLESKTKKIKGLCKAYSMEASGPSQGSTSGHRLISSKSKVGRSIDDFRPGSQVPQKFHSGTHGSGNGRESGSGGGGGGGRGSKQLSPGERRDLQKLLFSRKRSGVKRQTSLYEGARRRDSSYAPGSSSASASVSKSDEYNRTKRRESADSIMKVPSESKSFLSRFSFVRQLSRTLHSGSAHSSVEESPLPPNLQSESVMGTSATSSSSSAIPIQTSLCSSIMSMSPSKASSVVREMSLPHTSSSVASNTAASSSSAASADIRDKDKPSSSTSLSHKSSSVGLLPLLSSTISSALSSSVKSDPGSATQTSSTPPTTGIFTIPSTSLPPSSQDSHHHHHHLQKYVGESQPLLKK